MKTTDSVMREILEKLVLEIGSQVTRDYEEKNGIWEGMSLSNVRSIDKALEALSHSLAEARREWVEEMRGKANLIEVRSEARYLTDSGFWATKKLVAKDDVLDLLTGDNPERKV